MNKPNLNLLDIYNSNKDFKTYVDRYIANKNKTIEDAFKEIIVQDVAKSYLPNGINYKGDKHYGN